MRHYRVYFGRFYFSTNDLSVEPAIERLKAVYQKLHGRAGVITRVERHHRDGSFIEIKAKKCLKSLSLATLLF